MLHPDHIGCAAEQRGAGPPGTPSGAGAQLLPPSTSPLACTMPRSESPSALLRPLAAKEYVRLRCAPQQLGGGRRHRRSRQAGVPVPAGDPPPRRARPCCAPASSSATWQWWTGPWTGCCATASRWPRASPCSTAAPRTSWHGRCCHRPPLRGPEPSTTLCLYPSHHYMHLFHTPPQLPAAGASAPGAPAALTPWMPCPPSQGPCLPRTPLLKHPSLQWRKLGRFHGPAAGAPAPPGAWSTQQPRREAQEEGKPLDKDWSRCCGSWLIGAGACRAGPDPGPLPLPSTGSWCRRSSWLWRKAFPRVSAAGTSSLTSDVPEQLLALLCPDGPKARHHCIPRGALPWSLELQAAAWCAGEPCLVLLCQQPAGAGSLGCWGPIAWAVAAAPPGWARWRQCSWQPRSVVLRSACSRFLRAFAPLQLGVLASPGRTLHSTWTWAWQLLLHATNLWQWPAGRVRVRATPRGQAKGPGEALGSQGAEGGGHAGGRGWRCCGRHWDHAAADEAQRCCCWKRCGGRALPPAGLGLRRHLRGCSWGRRL